MNSKLQNITSLDNDQFRVDLNKLKIMKRKRKKKKTILQMRPLKPFKKNTHSSEMVRVNRQQQSLRQLRLFLILRIPTRELLNRSSKINELYQILMNLYQIDSINIK